MFTKFVVRVASVSRTAPDAPMPTARSMAPGSVVPAALAAMTPSGINQMLVNARPRNTAQVPLTADRVYRE